MKQIVECIPNFSEGRNAETVALLATAVQAIRGVSLLDQHMDADHHRAVLTIVGEPEPVAQAAFEAIRVAVALIDLRGHTGEHPRVGAVDVVPFVPIRETTMDECVELAKQVGKRVGSELELPVFLYECACPHPTRARIEVIRRGGLRSLVHRMETDPLWIPDFGPSQLHPTAGAVAISARFPLIAYNVNLESKDLAVAKAIAQKVRSSGGGLPALKAIGVDLKSRGQVQVSMNLTNFHETSIHDAFQAVTREAEQQGVCVAGSELVGLVPQDALNHAIAESVKLDGFNPNQVLETRVNSNLSQ